MLLLELRRRASQFASVYEERLEDYVFELVADDASVRSVAAAIGVGPSTVQKWATSARRRHDRDKGA